MVSEAVAVAARATTEEIIVEARMLFGFDVGSWWVEDVEILNLARAGTRYGCCLRCSV